MEARDSLVNSSSGSGRRTKDQQNDNHATEDEHSKKPVVTSYIFSIKTFVAVTCTIGILLATDTMLRFALLTTLERRFKFKTVENGIIIASYDIGHVVLLLVLSYTGHKIHKPRACAFGGFLAVASGILWALPHFMFGAGVRTNAITATNTSAIERSLGICVPSFNSSFLNDPCLSSSNSTLEAGVTVNSVESTVAFWFLFLSQCILGAGLAPFITVGLTYIDDNTDPQTSALCVGIVYSLSSMGLVVGLMLGAATSSIYVDLTPTHLTQRDPEWIGAWWLGSLVIACIQVFTSLPLVFFPRRLVPQPEEKSSVFTRAISTERLEEAKQRATQMRPMLQKKVTQIDDVELKEMPKKSKGLFQNPLYMLATIAMCCVSFLPGGLFTFLPKYYETQFLLPTMMANVITALVTTLAIAMGTFFGGYISSRLQLKIRGYVKLILITTTIGGVVFLATLFLGCPQPELGGTPGTDGVVPRAQCNSNCSCGLDFSPVCGSDHVNYYSPCFAGCSDQSIDSDKGFGNCTCVKKGVGSATPGFCDSGCKTLVPYALSVFITTFCICLGQPPVLSLIIRCVEPDQKAFGLGINNFLTSILGTIPAPILYGRLIDTSCVMMEQNCGGRGRCLVYDNATYRYIMHGITLGMIVLTIIFCGFMWLNVRNMNESDVDQSQEANGKTSRQPEEVPMMEMSPRV